MPAFQVQAGGTAVEQCDARGPHSLVFGPNDRSDGLQSLAPIVFTGGGSAPVTGGLGQFASLLLDSVERLSQAGAPTKSIATHRCSDVALDRLWGTVLQILSQKDASYQYFFFTGQRGEFVSRLRGLRASASPTQLARFEISDADLELISADTTTVPGRFAVVLLSAPLTVLAYLVIWGLP